MSFDGNGQSPGWQRTSQPKDPTIWSGQRIGSVHLSLTLRPRGRKEEWSEALDPHTTGFRSQLLQWLLNFLSLICQTEVTVSISQDACDDIKWENACPAFNTIVSSSILFYVFLLQIKCSQVWNEVPNVVRAGDVHSVSGSHPAKQAAGQRS